MKKICLLIGFCLVLAFASSAYAVVGLDASAAKVTVPKERTTKIGAALDGIVPTNAPVVWVAGQNYVGGNRLKASLNNSAEFSGTWAGVAMDSAAAEVTIGLQNLAAGNPTILLQINTTGVVNGDTISLRQTTGAGGLVDVSSVTASAVTLKGVTLTSGLGTVDQPGSDTLVETLTQYSSAATNATTVIDAINHAAKRFVDAATTAGTLLAQGGSVVIQSTNAFGGSTVITPRLAVGDQIVLTLKDETAAFAGLTQVYFQGVAANATVALGNATSQSFTLTAAQIAAMKGTTDFGINAEAFTVGVQVKANGTTELQPRTIVASKVDLGLTATGNGTTTLSNLGTVLTLDQNGTLYRANYARYDDNTTQNMFYKFSNNSGTAMKVEVRYHDKDATAAGTWTDYSADVPAYGVLTISKTGLDGVLGLGAGNYNGWVEFRIHGNEAFITAICNAKYGDTWFNVPMSLNDAAPSWTH